VIKKEAEKILKYKYLAIENRAYVECENKSDTCSNTDSWNHLNTIQKITGIHAWKARYQGTI
jgi:hypothetical protein